MLSQMAPFCLNSRGHLCLPGRNIGRLKPRRTSTLEQIRFWTVTTLLGAPTPISSGSTAVSQECGHFSTPFTPSALARSHKQRSLSELVFISKHKLFFPSLSSSQSSGWGLSNCCLWRLKYSKSIFLSLISIAGDMGVGRRNFSASPQRLTPSANQLAPKWESGTDWYLVADGKMC